MRTCSVRIGSRCWGTAILGNGIPAFLFAVAQTSINSSLSGMLNSLTPLFTLLVGIALFGIRIRTINVVGILLGLAGAVGTIAYRHGDGLPSWTVHAVLPAIGALCYGFSGNIIKRWLYMLPPAATSVLAISIVGPMGLNGVLVTGLPHTLATVPNAWPALGFTAILATFSTGISLILWNALIKRTSAVWASSVTYLMPIVAIGWGVFDGRNFGTHAIPYDRRNPGRCVLGEPWSAEVRKPNLYHHRGTEDTEV
jgi:drug/metabolite transporter (DMT)-like permease